MPKIILISRCAWTLYNFRAGLMRELKAKGWTVLGGGAGGDGFENQVEGLGVPFVPLPIDKQGINPLADLKLIWTLYRWYRRERPDVVHHFTIKPVIYGSIAGHWAGVPRIVNTVTGLGFVFTGGGKYWLRKLVERLYRVALNHAHVIFFQNPDDRTLFLERQLLEPGKAGLLPGSGIDLVHFAPQKASENSGSDSPLLCKEGLGEVGRKQPGTGAPLQQTGENPFPKVVFLLASRLLRDKGVVEFVEAARQVRKNHPEAQFHLLGARDERNPTVISQEELDAWQAEEVVRWLGFEADVRPALAQADVAVLPSYREGTPRSLLESAAMAKPIIATDTAGCREVVEDGVNGILIPVKDTKSLAQAMIRMIENPEMRKKMGQAGRLKVEKEFDERIVIEKMLKVYF